MRRFSFGVTLAALPAFALALLVGCGGGRTVRLPPARRRQPKIQGNTKKELTVLEPGKGVLKGKITLNGKPDLMAMTAKLHEEMKKKDTEYCMKGKETETTEQAYRVSDKGLLGNVFVWVVPDSGTFFKVDEEAARGIAEDGRDRISPIVRSSRTASSSSRTIIPIRKSPRRRNRRARSWKSIMMRKSATTPTSRAERKIRARTSPWPASRRPQVR